MLCQLILRNPLPLFRFLPLPLRAAKAPSSAPAKVKLTTLMIPDGFRFFPLTRKPRVSRRITRMIAMSAPCQSGMSRLCCAAEKPAAAAQIKLMAELQ